MVSLTREEDVRAAVDFQVSVCFLACDPDIGEDEFLLDGDISGRDFTKNFCDIFNLFSKRIWLNSCRTGP